jgi:hypothetical protein
VEERLKGFSPDERLNGLSAKEILEKLSLLVDLQTGRGIYNRPKQQKIRRLS